MTEDPKQDANVTTTDESSSNDPWNRSAGVRNEWNPPRGWHDALALAEELGAEFKKHEFSRPQVAHFVVAVEIRGTWVASASQLLPNEYRIWLRLPPASVGLRISGCLDRISEFYYEPISARLHYTSWSGWEPFLGAKPTENEALLSLARAAFRYPNSWSEGGQ